MLGRHTLLGSGCASSPSALGALQSIIDGLHSRGQRFVPIVEPVVHVQKGYATYDSGIAEDVFVKDVRGEPYLGQVAPFAALLLPGYSHGVHPAALPGLGCRVWLSTTAGQVAAGSRRKSAGDCAVGPCVQSKQHVLWSWFSRRGMLRSGSCSLHSNLWQLHCATGLANYEGSWYGKCWVAL